MLTIGNARDSPDELDTSTTFLAPARKQSEAHCRNQLGTKQGDAARTSAGRLPSSASPLACDEVEGGRPTRKPRNIIGKIAVYAKRSPINHLGSSSRFRERASPVATASDDHC